MLIVAKKTPTPEECRRWLATPEGLIQAATRIDGKRTRLTAYQKHHLRNKARFRAWEKGRGVGFSLTCAAEATVRAIVRPSYSAIFVSVNREEADEKIRYANTLHDSMPLSWQKKKVVDNRASIEFEDPSGGGRSRLISHPCKDPRGKHNADLYLDEFAHFGPRKQRSIYVASLPVVSRGGRQLTIGSTPLVAGDLFHDIMRQEHKKYSTFSRQSVPWWICPDLCADVRRAGKEAPGMDTVERVERFAREALLDVFRSLDVAAFRQEYELLFPDESENYFPYDLIFSCVSDELSPAPSVDKLFRSTKGDLYAGFDVGRTRNTSELVVLERLPKRLVYRYGRSFDRSRFKDQEASLRKMMKRSRRLKRLCIDRHGIGMNMAENLRSEFGSRVEGVAMIGPVKESLAVGMHIVLENEEIALPRDRELIAQVHSVRKSATNAGYSRYDTETNAKAHADVLWALALAVHAAGITRERKRRRKVVSASIV